MQVLVIHERDHSDGETMDIGVADSVENAALLIDQYYGKNNYTLISFRDIRDSGLESSEVIQDEEGNKYTVTLGWFEINKL